MDVIGTEVFQIDRVAHRRRLGSFGFRDRNRRIVGLSKLFGRRLFIVHIKSDVVNAAHLGGLSGAKLWSAGFAILQNSKINIAVAEPHTLLAGIAGSPIELGQAEMLLVEFCGFRRIVSDERNMPDASHSPFSLAARAS